MLSRFLSLLLILAIAFLSQSAMSVPPPRTASMSCCAQPGHGQTCPDCPASPSGNHGCCSIVQAVVLSLPAPHGFVFSQVVASYVSEDEDFGSRNGPPLLPPPKVA